MASQPRMFNICASEREHVVWRMGGRGGGSCGMCLLGFMFVLRAVRPWSVFPVLCVVPTSIGTEECFFSDPGENRRVYLEPADRFVLLDARCLLH